MSRAPVLEREEYVEQAYFFRMFRDRLKENLASQEILSRLHEEILSTTRLPLAIQYLATELKHSGLLSPGMLRLAHYFTPFQAFVASKAEEEGLRFSMDSALQILEGEATYRSGTPTRAGLFVYQIEVLSRHRLGYDQGILSMVEDDFYDDEWRAYASIVRKSIGEVDFAALVYLRSETYVQDQTRLDPTQTFPPVLFGHKEGKIARASRGRDPLFLFAALQRQLGYPAVPRIIPKDDPLAKLLTLQAKVRDLELKVKILEMESRGQTDFIKDLGKPEILEAENDE
jgi:hypothetical protein